MFSKTPLNKPVPMQTVQLTNSLSLLFGLVALIHIIVCAYAELYLLAAILGFYSLALLAVPFLNSLKYHNSSKFLFLFFTNILFYLFSQHLGSESNIHWVLIALVITPNILFSYSNKKELSFSVLFQVFAVANFLFNHLTYHYSNYSFNYEATIYIQYSSIFLLIAATAAQIFYLLYIVNKNEQTLKAAFAEISTYKKALDEAAIVSATDKHGQIIEANDNFCKISGYPQQELIGKNHRILKSGFHTDEFYTEIWKTVSSGKIWRGEICNKNKNGNIYWVDSSIIPCYDDDNKIEKYFSVRFDITNKKIIEEQLLHAAKMSSLGEMAGGVAHEINTPLAIIQVRAEQLLDVIENNNEALDREKLKKLSNNIDITVKRISKIIQGLRTFSRDSRSDAMTQHSVNTIIQEAIGLCHEKLKYKDIKVDIASSLDIDLLCRPTEIEQVLLNLISNAIDAIENLPHKWIRLDLKKTADSIELSVTDSGQGIPKEVRDKMMQPFFTTKELGKGTGLGLSISRGIIKSHNGELIIDPECINTRFIIKLPHYS